MDARIGHPPVQRRILAVQFILQRRADPNKAKRNRTDNFKEVCNQEVYEAGQRSNELGLEADVSACPLLVRYADLGHVRLPRAAWFFLLYSTLCSRSFHYPVAAWLAIRWIIMQGKAEDFPLMYLGGNYHYHNGG